MLVNKQKKSRKSQRKRALCLFRQKQFTAEWIDLIKVASAFKLLQITKVFISVHFGRLVLVTKVWIRNHKNAVIQPLR